jgi:hypothetical protein
MKWMIPELVGVEKAESWQFPLTISQEKRLIVIPGHFEMFFSCARREKPFRLQGNREARLLSNVGRQRCRRNERG